MSNNTEEGIFMICLMAIVFIIGIVIGSHTTVNVPMIEEAMRQCADKGGLLYLEGTMRASIAEGQCVDGTKFEKDTTK